jgi:hypothetical protein
MYQRSRYNCVKGMIEEAIHEKFDVSTMEDAIRIVDLGCSVGPNTFYTVQTIIDATWATLKKAPRHQAQAYEFQVFFNDQITNDFNTLFGTIPPDRRYFVAGVPGSFYSRLFPRDSVHFFNSTMALHWLSKTPAGVTNKGRVQIYGGGPTILNAHVAQFRADVEAFLRFRAEELVGGGLLAMLFLCRPQGIDLTTSKLEWWVTYLEPILRELVLEVRETATTCKLGLGTPRQLLFNRTTGVLNLQRPNHRETCIDNSYQQGGASIGTL